MDPNLFEARVQSTKNQVANPAFISDVERLFQHRPLTVLDLGALRGALVKSFLQRGHFAMGLERERQTGEHWEALLDKFLIAGDISQSLFIKGGGEPLVQFDVMIGINLADLIHPDQLSLFFANIQRHLKIGGLFIGSISLRDHFPQNNQIQLWQNYILRRLEGLQFIEYPFEHIPYPIFTSFYYGLVRT